MSGQRVNRVTNWRPVQPRGDAYKQIMPPVTESVARNPWRFESDRPNYKAIDLSALQAGRKRRRTFSGQIDPKLLNFPSTHADSVRRRVAKIALIAFIAADLTLVFVFLASLL